MRVRAPFHARAKGWAAACELAEARAAQIRRDDILLARRQVSALSLLFAFLDE